MSDKGPIYDEEILLDEFAQDNGLPADQVDRLYELVDYIHDNGSYRALRSVALYLLRSGEEHEKLLNALCGTDVSADSDVTFSDGYLQALIDICLFVGRSIRQLNVSSDELMEDLSQLLEG